MLGSLIGRVGLDPKPKEIDSEGRVDAYKVPQSRQGYHTATVMNQNPAKRTWTRTKEWGILLMRLECWIWLRRCGVSSRKKRLVA
jgi:hypothetical protein